jgi:lipoprotein-anchoring transpeptidase ErfK/SrfK
MAKSRPARFSTALWWSASLAGLSVLGWVFWHAGQTRIPDANAPKKERAAEVRIPSKTAVTSAIPRLPASAASLPVASNLPAPAVPAAPAVTNPSPPTLVATNFPPVIDKEPPPESAEVLRPVQNLFEAQIALARQGISSGSIDGVLGSQTRAALRVYQQQQKITPTGTLDVATKTRLFLSAPATTNYTITPEDLDRLMVIPKTWLGKSEQKRLDYETILELVAEKAHAHPNLIRRLNPGLAWTNGVPAGTTVVVPAPDYPPCKGKASYARIHLAAKTLEVFDPADHLLAHFPCSVARQVEKRPVGQLQVVTVVTNPNYVFKPEIFPESAEARELGRRLVLPPGPNNPVGVAWVGLNRSGYGIHGTPKPEEVGRTESHGCFRLANWNAEYFAQLVSIGTTVFIDP